MIRPAVLLVLAVLSVLLVQMPARAQLRFQMKDVETQVDESEVEVGDSVHVSMRVMSESGMPERPDLGPHPGFTVRGGPSISTTSSVQIVNGRTSSRRGITATWTLTATTLGTFTVGPPTAFVGTTKITSDAVRIKVVKKGTLQRGSNPIDPFGGPSTLDPWKSFFGMQEPKDPRVAPATDPSLGLDHDDSEPFFLHATIDKAQAVVGEQVTYTSFLYVDADLGDQDFIMEHEAAAASFLKQTLVADDSSKQLGYGKVRGRVYRVKQVRKVAYFPVTTGTLTIGEQEVRYPLGNRYVNAKSEQLTVKVVEPPAKGRPLGYTLGDTGHFELSADVKPRDIDQGDVTSINVTLTGTGNVPRAALPLPLQKDVAFLQPEVSEKLGTTETGRFAATDTFRYVVRVDRAGDVDLGTIELPYYDPDAKTYGTARAVLGVVHVKKGDIKQAAPSDPNPIVLPETPPPMDTLDGTRAAAASHVSDSSWFWLALCGSPLSYAFLRAGGVAAARIQKRRKERAESPDAELARRRKDAKDKARGESGKDALSAVKRYVEELALARTGVNVKGAPAEGVASLLEDAGVRASLAKETSAVLTECADLAFSPEDVPVAEARALLERAEKLYAALGKDEAA